MAERINHNIPVEELHKNTISRNETPLSEISIEEQIASKSVKTSTHKSIETEPIGNNQIDWRGNFVENQLDELY